MTLTGYHVTNLAEMLKGLEEGKVISLLSSYSCPFNADVENFLRHRAIEFTRQCLASTYVVFSSYREEAVIIGYFTLCSKHLMIPEKCITSVTLLKRLKKFGETYQKPRRIAISIPLIAQLGKNYTNGYDKLISGDELLKLACRKVADNLSQVSGQFTYVECVDHPKLINFYVSNGFIRFADRKLAKSELNIDGKGYLVQLIKRVDIEESRNARADQFLDTIG